MQGWEVESRLACKEGWTMHEDLSQARFLDYDYKVEIWKLMLIAN